VYISTIPLALLVSMMHSMKDEHTQWITHTDKQTVYLREF